MKKFLIGIIFLIPILVVMALSAAGTIITYNQQVFPTDIIIKNNNNEIITDTIEIDEAELEAYIIVEILPTISFSKKIGYYHDDVDGYNGKVEILQIDGTNKCKIIPKQNGMARVIIYSAVEANVSRAITIHIASREIKQIKIYNESGEAIDSVKPLTSMQLYYDIFPMDAVDNRQIAWVSDDEAVAKINKNGMLYPVSRGRTSLHVYATDKNGIRNDRRIEVDTRGALVSRSEVFVTAPVSADYIKDTVALGKNAVVNKVEGAEPAMEDKFIVTENGNSTEVYTKIAEHDSWGFFDVPDVVYTNNGATFLECHGLISYMQKLQSVSYSLSNAAVAAIVGDEFVPLKAGKTILTAAYNGRKISKEITVKERPFSFELMLNNEDNKRGIQRNRVWGYNWITDNGYTHQFQFGAKLSEVDGMSASDLAWSVDNPLYANIDQNALITFNEEALGKTVVVTATVLVNGRFSDNKRSYAFNIVDKANAVNIYDWQSLKNIAQGNNNNMVLQNSISIEHSLLISKSIYGNGFTVSAETLNLDASDKGQAVFEIRNYDYSPTFENVVRIENFTVIGADSFENTARIHRAFGIYDCHGSQIIAKNLQIKNCTRGIDAYNVTDLLLEGNLLGDNSGPSLLLTYDPDIADKSVVVLRNNVFKYSKGPSINLSLRTFSKELFARAYNPTLKIEGFLDCYNWKRTDDFGEVFDSFGLTHFGSLEDFIKPETLVQAIKAVLNQFATSEYFTKLSYKHTDKNNYIGMGVFALGAMATIDASRFIIEDNRLKLVEFDLSKTDGTIGGILQIINQITMANGMPITKSCYFLGYDYSNSAPAYLPNDPIPQTLELYDKLNGITKPKTE